MFIEYGIDVRFKNERSTVEPRYPDTLRTRENRRHKRSVAVTGVGETYVYKKLNFFIILRQF